MHIINVFDYCSVCCHLYYLTAAVSFLVVSSAVTMSAPFFLGKVIDTVYTNSSADINASLTSLCIMLAGVFLCGGAANAARVYLIQVSGELSAETTKQNPHEEQICFSALFIYDSCNIETLAVDFILEVV